MSLWHLGLADFRDRTASDQPTPGGGSVAMVSASLGLGLVLMALRVSARRAEDTGAFDALILKGDRLLDEISRHADADVDVFEAYMAAMRMPKESEEDKTARRDAMRQAAIAATEVPLNGAQSALEGLDLARQAVDVCDRTIVSDVGAGAALLAGAIEAVLLNVDINLGSIKEAARAADYRKSREHLAASAEQRHGTVRRAVAARLAA